MKNLFVRCNSGISGNMFVGALLDSGVPVEYLENTLRKLSIAGYHLVVKPEIKQGVAATYFNVHLHEHPHNHTHEHNHDDERNHDHENSNCLAHEHSHTNACEHEHSHTHDHDHIHDNSSGHEHSHGEQRGFTAIKKIIEDADLPKRVKELSVNAFYHLGMAEAKVHESTLEEVHFHEVGAIDCIIDIVGTMACIDYLNIDNIWFSPLHVGQGKVMCDHGLMDIPTPATTELLQGIETYTMEGVTGELVTPTGAALVVALSEQSDVWPETMGEPSAFWKGAFDSLDGVHGNGAGTLDLAIPNVTETVCLG